MQQKYIHREKRDGVPTDPKFGEMWYLVRTCYLLSAFFKLELFTNSENFCMSFS